jgi:hypothetical protein
MNMDDDKKKTEGTALAVQETRISLPQAQEYAKIFIDSGLFEDTKDMAKATVKILAGREIGVEPLTAMTGIHLIKGKVAIGANLMASAIKRSGKYNYRIIKHNDNECVIEFYEGTELLGSSSFSMADAQRAEINRDNYRKYPKDMVFARAISRGVKWYCPDVFGCTVYDPSELKDDFPEEKEKKRGRPRGEQPPSQSVQDAEFREAPKPSATVETHESIREEEAAPVESPKAETPAKPAKVETPTPSPKEPENVPEAPAKDYDIKTRQGMITAGMSPRAAYGKIQEHCFRTNQSDKMNKMVMDVVPDAGDYSYHISESACAKMVRDITGMNLKLIEKTPKCKTCDNITTEPEAIEQDSLCLVCFKKKQESE